MHIDPSPSLKRPLL